MSGTPRIARGMAALITHCVGALLGSAAGASEPRLGERFPPAKWERAAGPPAVSKVETVPSKPRLASAEKRDLQRDKLSHASRVTVDKDRIARQKAR